MLHTIGQQKSVDYSRKFASAKGIFDFILELIRITVICASIIILVRWLLFEPFIVKGFSMEPNYEDGEYLIILQLPYRFQRQFHPFTAENRGTPVIFHPPNDPKQFYIKRIIGLPGETVKIEDGRVKIVNSANLDGFYLQEEYLPSELKTLAGAYGEVKLKMDEVYVLGDNRRASLDSRRIGPVPIKNVIGRPIFRGWPFDRIEILKGPFY